MSIGRRALLRLLETLSGVGYRNALAAKDEWQQKWWERATYLASTLERLGEELQSNGEAIETALYAIGKGGSARARRTQGPGHR